MGDMAKTMGAVMAVSDFQDSLRDDQGRPVKTELLPPEKGAAPDGHTLNALKVTTQDGKTVIIYFDAYHPELGVARAPAPKGFTRVDKEAAKKVPAAKEAGAKEEKPKPKNDGGLFED